MGITLKGKNFSPNSFFLGQIPFQKRIGVKESKQEVIKDVSLVENGEKSTKSIQFTEKYGGTSTSFRKKRKAWSTLHTK